MKTVDAWFGTGIAPSFVFATLIVALLVTAMSPLVIKRRMRSALLLCLAYGIVVSIATLLVKGGPVRQQLEAAAYLFAALAAARVVFVVVVDIGWERAGRVPINQLLRDVLQTAAYAIAAITGLRAAGIQPTSLIATGTVVTAIVGLSLQETLGNLAAGVALQVDKPVALGDWIRLDKGDILGKVVSTNWRSVTIQGDDRCYLVVPNGYFTRNPFTNFSRPGQSYRRSIYIQVPYDVPPNRVQLAVLAACRDTAGVLEDPAPSVLTWQFQDHGIQYWIRFFIGDFAARDRVVGELGTRIWFHLKRHKIDFAVPVRKSFITEVDEEALATQAASTIADRRAAVDTVDFLRPLSDDAKDMLARRGHRKLFGTGETILRRGETGREFYVIRRGSVSIRDHEREVAQLHAGDFFGELALLTGTERHATVVAAEETEVFEIDEKIFKDVLESQPKIAEEISRIVAERQEANNSLRTGVPSTHARTDNATSEILGKIKNLFGLD
ncbi:MAG: cyclic nucleotide-binding domain-containing protein [Polyangiales bacterium]